jgi:hypothetical protein
MLERVMVRNPAKIPTLTRRAAQRHPDTAIWSALQTLWEHLHPCRTGAKTRTFVMVFNTEFCAKPITVATYPPIRFVMVTMIARMDLMKKIVQSMALQ